MDKSDLKPGAVYVVSSPIGNMDDITLRALKILKNADLIAAEDTRVTGKLLSVHGIQTKMVSLHEHNENERVPELIGQLLKGLNIAVVSDAGTPGVSDPGYRLVREALDNGMEVIPVPGVSAAVTALSVSGCPTDAFVFIGFPPKKYEKKRTLLKSLSQNTKTLIFYESPKRIMDLLRMVADTMGDRDCVLAREMTKRHEEFIRGKAVEIIKSLERKKAVKGECTLIITGFDEDRKKEAVSEQTFEKELKEMLDAAEKPLSEISKIISRRYGIPKTGVYEKALRLKNTASGKKGQP